MSLFRPVEHIKRVDGTKAGYTGTVIFNKDPKRAGRVKCTIPDLFVGGPDELPWCYPENAGTGGGKSTNTSFSVPEIGALVNITFRNDDILNPVYSGSPQNEATTNTLFEENYPDSYGQVDSTGFYWKMNKVTKLLTVHHPGGVDITVDATGKVTVRSTDETIRLESGKKIEVIAPEIDLTASTKVNVTAPQAYVTASDKAIISAGAAEVAASAIKLTGAMTFAGNVSLQGSLTASGNISSMGKSLAFHIHGNGNMGSPTTPPM